MYRIPGVHGTSVGCEMPIRRHGREIAGRRAYGLYVERAVYILFRYIRLDFMQTPYALVHAIYII